MQKSKNTLLGRIVLLLGVLPLAFVLSSCGKSETVTFQAQTDDGIFDSSQFKGDVIYVDFWASWCVPCRASFPWMNEMLAKYEDQGLKIVGVTLDQDQILARQFAEEFKAEFTIAFDLDGALANQFGVKALPSSVLIDRKGNLVANHTGFNETQAIEYEASIAKALK